MNSQFAAYPVFNRVQESGSWDLDFNHYSAKAPQPCIFESGSVRTNLSGWKLNNPGFDENSTASDASYPDDVVMVIPNSDAPKRAHIAVYNWTLADNVSVNVGAILNDGDTFHLYSAQDYGAGAISTGVVSSGSISVPMTNLTTAPIVCAEGWGMAQPIPMSPEFGAFVLIGSAPLHTHTIGSASFGAGSIQ